MKVELIGHYGSDLTHAQSAWVSTSRELTEDKLNRVDKLLLMLANEGHHTPFEKSSLHFLITTDVATHIQCLKHRISVSINTESARYKELKEDKFYIPEDWKGIKCTDRLIVEEFMTDDWAEIMKRHSIYSNNLYHKSLVDVAPVLGRKRAKESARFFKGYNSELSYDIMFNFRSFNHFINLRIKDDAQLEIRKLSEDMVNLVKDIPGNPFEHTLKAFNL